MHLRFPEDELMSDDENYSFPVPRIIIIGNSGTGKTTLAKEIAELMQISHIELDGIFHQSNWTPMPVDEFRRTVQEATSAENWVTCGNYSAVRDILWERADTVIAIDLPKWLNMWRVLQRTVKRVIRREELWNGNRETFSKVLAVHDKDKSILRWAWSAHGDKREEIRRVMADPQWSDKSMYLITNQSERDALVAEIRRLVLEGDGV